MTEPALATTPPVPFSRHPRLAVAVISCAQLMVVLDASIVFVALPTIQHSLHVSIASLVWVTAAYALTFGGLLVFGGRTGDIYGKRRMFMVGIGIFTAASFLGGLAPYPWWLIAARALQGVGGAIASPTALSLITTSFAEGPARTGAMAIYAAMSGVGSTVGLLAGGILTEYASWRGVLFVNAPIGAIVLIVAPRVLSEGRSRSGRLDIPGAIGVTAGMTLVVYGLTNAASHGWGSQSTIVCLAVAGVALSLFVAWEQITPRPLMPLGIFASRNRAAVYVMNMCLGAGIFGASYFVTLYIQEVLRYGPLGDGLAFLPWGMVIAAVSQLTARMINKVGLRLPLLIGLPLTVVGLWWLSRLSIHSTYLHVLVAFILMGTGMGMSIVPIALTAVSGVSSEESGLAAALLNTGQQIGGGVGLAVLSTVAVTGIRARTETLAGSGHSPLSQSLSNSANVFGWDKAFLVGAGMAVLALVLSWVALRVPKTTAHDVRQQSGATLEPEASLDAL